MMSMTPDELARVLETFAAEIRQEIRKDTKAIEVNIRHEVLANQLKTRHELMEAQQELRHDLAKIRHDLQTLAHEIEMSQEVPNDKLEALNKVVSATGDKFYEMGLLLTLEVEVGEESDWFGQNSAIEAWAAWILDSLLGDPDEAR
ncbi:hypothetical protein TsFJ059_003906 [Trichoderma semiorbis]|uniref:Uncharacterized protein n=1 Tax=Trichoderma semiorbis TaxID=1491008 RepID=A0A9P8HMI7_9HYPO|nr:hypothetical protein TsFJ059_003906 [Trichoderma semiorbis]